MGRLKSVAVFVSADTCSDGAGMEDPMPCCEDTTEELKVEELTKTAFNFKTTADFQLLATVSYVLLGQMYPDHAEGIKYPIYDPPLPDPDLLVLNQVFLI